MFKSSPNSQNPSSSAASSQKQAYRDLPTLGWINIGLRRPTLDGQSSVLISPFFGIEVKEVSPKQKLSERDLKLLAAIHSKIADVAPGETIKLQLEVEFTRPKEKAEISFENNEFNDCL